MKKLLSLLLILICYKSLLFGSESTSEVSGELDVPWYEVEIIVFEQSNDVSLNSEKWQQDHIPIQLGDAIDFLSTPSSKIHLSQICVNGELFTVSEQLPYETLIEDDLETIKSEPVIIEEVDTLLNNPLAVNQQTPSPFDVNTNNLKNLRESNNKSRTTIIDSFKKLPQNDLKLGEVSSALTKRRGYSKLLHISWRQPIVDEHSSPKIRIHGGINYSEKYKPDGNSRIQFAEFNPEISNRDNLLIQAQDENEQLRNVHNNNIEGAHFRGSSINNVDFENSKADSEYISKGIPTDNNQHLFDQFNNNDFQLENKSPEELISEKLDSCEVLNQEIAKNKHPDVWQLDGTINLSVERYLHLNTNLVLRIPGTETIELSAIETNFAADRLLSNLNKQLDEPRVETNISQDYSKSTIDGFDFNHQNTKSTDTTDRASTTEANKSERNQYIKVDENLFSKDFLNSNPNSSTVTLDVLNSYHMKQNRRLRSNELHYIDHPLFGLLIQIRPIDFSNTEEFNESL